VTQDLNEVRALMTDAARQRPAAIYALCECVLR
jgi:hypothetical protein